MTPEQLTLLNNAISALIAFRDSVQPGPERTIGEKGTVAKAMERLANCSLYCVSLMPAYIGGRVDCFAVFRRDGSPAPHPWCFPIDKPDAKAKSIARRDELNAAEGKAVPVDVPVVESVPSADAAEGSSTVFYSPYGDDITVLLSTEPYYDTKVSPKLSVTRSQKTDAVIGVVIHRATKVLRESNAP